MIETEPTCPFCQEPTGGRVCGLCLQALELLGLHTVRRARLQLVVTPRCEVVACSRHPATKLRKVMGREEKAFVCDMCNRADRLYRTDGFGLRVAYGF